MPVLGGLKADNGKVGRDLGPFLRAPTPGDMGGLGRVAIVVAVTVLVGLDLSNNIPDTQSFPRLNRRRARVSQSRFVAIISSVHQNPFDTAI